MPLRPDTADRPPPRALHLDLPLLPEAALGHTLQCIDLLRSLQTLARLRLGQAAPYIGWQLLDEHGAPLPWAGSAALAPYAGAPAPAGLGARLTRAVFLPPLHAPDVPTLRHQVARQAGLVRLLGQALDAGGWLLTLGSGAWLAARTGRLAGQAVALPWFYVAGFLHDFPELRPEVEAPLWTRPPWLSAAVPAQLAGLVTALVRHSLGAELATLCQRVFAADAARGRTALQAADQIPSTRNSALGRAVAWMEQHLEAPYRLATVAQAAAVSPRTLLRLFRQELGCSPLDHLHQLRCERARVLLEVTLESVPSIALACGYHDPTAFRRVFARHSGLTPTAYREQHALRAPRSRWRVDPDLLPQPLQNQ